MNRRALTAIVVVMLALWGVGLPRFAHVMTAHVPGDGWNSATSASCCSHCALSRDAAEPTEPVEADEQDEHRGGEGAHHCPVCALLATLLTNVPALPLASLAWEPVVARVAETPAAIAARIDFDPHAPRGPPTMA